MMAVLDATTFTPICNVVIANDNQTLTKLAVSEKLNKRYFQPNKVKQPLQFLNDVLKENSLVPLVQEEIDYIKNHDLVGDFTKKEFTIEDIQKVAGVK